MRSQEFLLGVVLTNVSSGSFTEAYIGALNNRSEKDLCAIAHNLQLCDLCVLLLGQLR